MTMTPHMPVKANARLMGVTDTALSRVIDHYVEQARSGRDDLSALRRAASKTAREFHLKLAFSEFWGRPAHLAETYPKKWCRWAARSPPRYQPCLRDFFDFSVWS